MDNFPYFDRLLAGLTICVSWVICLLIQKILFDCIPWNLIFLLLCEAVQGSSRSWPPNVKIILLTQNPTWSLWCPSDRVLAGLKCWAQVSSPGQRKLFLFYGVEAKASHGKSQLLKKHLNIVRCDTGHLFLSIWDEHLVRSGLGMISQSRTVSWVLHGCKHTLPPVSFSMSDCPGMTFVSLTSPVI